MTFTMMTGVFMAIGIVALVGIGIFTLWDDIDLTNEEEA